MSSVSSALCLTPPVPGLWKVAMAILIACLVASIVIGTVRLVSL
jgi:hypothetical protein